ncbi:MAG: Smr/MutS family protein [Flavobacteriales bacterium]|nr:Smr/MutS family protein [Flavobacteriales bacterium]
MKPGDYVVFLHEKGGGKIIRIENNIAWVETDQGIDIPYPISELVIIEKSEKKPISSSLSTPIIKEKKNEIKLSKPNESEFNWESLEEKKIPKIKDPNFRADITYIGESHHQTKMFKNSNEEVWETDLHIHELMDDFERLSPSEILEIQIKHFHAFMEKAIRQKIRRVIIIHGVGTGRLKAEIQAAASKYPTHSIHDAPLKKYGRGATEILLRISG